MRWFKQRQQPDIWEVVDSRPLDDIEAAQRIREICQSAGSIADRSATNGRRVESDKAKETERYQAAIRRALEITMKISDDAMRDMAVCHVIDLCLRANQMKTARILVRAIKSDESRTELVAGNPALRE